MARKIKEKKVKNKSKKYYYGIGRRKSTVATVRLYNGKGDNLINKRKRRCYGGR